MRVDSRLVVETRAERADCLLYSRYIARDNTKSSALAQHNSTRAPQQSSLSTTVCCRKKRKQGSLGLHELVDCGLHWTLENIRHQYMRLAIVMSHSNPKRSDDKSEPVWTRQVQDSDDDDAFVATTTTTVGPNDILMGRGAPITENPGNTKLRELVVQHIPDYARAVKQKDKHAVALRILEQIHQRGGRFLRKTNDKEHAFVVVKNEKEKITKVKQLLRDMEPHSLSKRIERRRYQYRKLGQKANNQNSTKSSTNSNTVSTVGASDVKEQADKTHDSSNDQQQTEAPAEQETAATASQSESLSKSTRESGESKEDVAPNTKQTTQSTITQSALDATRPRTRVNHPANSLLTAPSNNPNLFWQAQQLARTGHTMPPLLPLTWISNPYAPWLLANSQSIRVPQSVHPFVGAHDPFVGINPMLAATAFAATARQISMPYFPTSPSAGTANDASLSGAVIAADERSNRVVPLSSSQQQEANQNPAPSSSSLSSS